MNTIITSFPLNVSVINGEKLNFIQGTSIRLFLGLKGTTTILIDNVPYYLEATDVVILNSYNTCTIFKSDSLLIALEIDVTQLALNEADKKAYFVCNSTLNKNKEKFSLLKSKIARLIINRNEISQAMAFSAAYEIYGLLLRDFTELNHRTKKVTNKINEIIKYVESNYSENLLLNDVADKFSFSAPYLSKLFKDSTGKSFGDFYDKLRVNHSLYDLLETNQPIIDVAFKHGFPNNHAYIRAFKKVAGILPNEARKKHKDRLHEKQTDNDDLTEIIELLDLTQSSPSNFTDVDATVDYNAKSEVILERNPSCEMLGIGPSIGVLRKNVQDIIRGIQHIFPFRYAYLRGIFSDAMSFCSRGFDGKLRFKYAMIDEVLDFLLSVKLKPALSLTYIPKALTKDNAVAFQDGYYICAPANYDEWHQLITNFLNHVISRYGINEIAEWIFIPWVQLDSQNKHLGFPDELSFSSFYKTSYNAVKSVSDKLVVSSPEIYPSADMRYLANYLQWCKFNNCFPDILAIKFFPNTDWKVIEINDGLNLAYRKLIDTEISADENLLNNSLRAIRSFLNKNGYNLDIYVTSFNYTITDTHPVLDTTFSANYYIKNYAENLDIIKSLCYWKLCDDDSDDEESAAPLFSGATGMFLKNGIAKDTAQALRFLSYIQPHITSRGDGYVLSTPKEQTDYYRLLLYNYEHPRRYDENITPDDSFDPYSLFPDKEKKRVHFKINHVPFSKATIKLFIMDSHYGSPYNKWVSMGKPYLDYYQDNDSVLFDILNTSTRPDFKMFDVPIVNGTLLLDFELELFDITTVEIILENKL